MDRFQRGLATRIRSSVASLQLDALGMAGNGSSALPSLNQSRLR